jgi:hypothetical protein
LLVDKPPKPTPPKPTSAKIAEKCYHTRSAARCCAARQLCALCVYGYCPASHAPGELRVHIEFLCRRALHRRQISCHQAHATERSSSASQCETVPFRPPVRVCRHSCTGACMCSCGAGARRFRCPRPALLAWLFFSAVLQNRPGGSDQRLLTVPIIQYSGPGPPRPLAGLRAEHRGHCVARGNI